MNRARAGILDQRVRFFCTVFLFALGRHLQACGLVVQRREQLLRGQRQQEPLRVSAGSSRHPALHNRRNQLRRCGLQAGTRVRIERRLLRSCMRSQQLGHQPGVHLRRNVHSHGRNVLDERRLLPRYSVRAVARIDQRRLRRRSATRRRHRWQQRRWRSRRGSPRRRGLLVLRTTLHDGGAVLQRSGVHVRSLPDVHQVTT